MKVLGIECSKNLVDLRITLFEIFQGLLFKLGFLLPLALAAAQIHIQSLPEKAQMNSISHF